MTPVLTARFAGVVLALSIVVAIAVRSLAGLIVVNVIALLVAAIDIGFAGSVRALRVRRDGAAATRLGEATTTAVVVRNDGRRRVRGIVRDAWEPTAGAEPTRSRLEVEAGRIATIQTTLTPTRRGARRCDRVTIRSFGPLGLAGRQGQHVAPMTLRVLPGFPSRRHLPSRLARLRELDGRTAIITRGQGSEFDSLREYVMGDDVRAIDWRASARAADVMIRLWRPERDRRIVIVLDTGRTSAARVGIGTRLDTAMDAALLLAALATKAGDRVDLIAFDRLVRAEIRSSTAPDQVAQFSSVLTDVQPMLVETDSRGLVAAVLGRVRQRALVVILTGATSSALREGLLPALPALCSRHLVILGTARDPDIEVLAHARGDIDAVYGAAAAGTALQDRADTTARLSSLGVEVIDSAPDQLAPDLADRYISLKAAGRL